MTPLVSVLIPSFNAAPYIGATLASVFAQSWPRLEVIVVDDGSEDDTAAVAARFGDRVQLIRQANRGQTAALNAALARARGDFIQYLDADDLISADKIALQVARLTAEPRAVATAEWARFRTSPDRARFRAEPEWRDLTPQDWLAESRRDGLGMMFPALWLVPRAIAEAAGPWREDLTLNNDADYFTRVVLSADRVLFCAGARCYYRSGVPGSLSGRTSPAAWSSQFAVLGLCEQRVRAREDSERIRRGFALSWQRLAHAAHPYDADLAARALGRARALHPVRIRPEGGRAFGFVSRVLGWRAARRLQVASGRP